MYEMTAIHYVGILVMLYLTIGMTIVGLVTAYQERNVWKPKILPSLSDIGFVKVFLCTFTWMGLCVFGAVVMIVLYVVTLGNLDMQYFANRLVEHNVSIICISLFVGKVVIVNRENLPPPESSIPAPVYIANHASQIDVGVIYFLNRRFKWIAKEPILFIPGIGFIMYLGKHIPIKRYGNNRSKSVKRLYEMSDEAVQSGVPMFLYPQGTRRIADFAPFKDGAFNIALKNKSPIVPITIHIPTSYNPWNGLYPLNLLWGAPAPVITLTVHKTLNVTGTEDIDSLKEECMSKIYSALPPPYYYESAKTK